MPEPINPPEEVQPDKPQPEKTNPFDECADDIISDATATCKTLGKIESGGKYSAKNPESSASGRYQFTHSTAVDVLTRSGMASSTNEANTIWNECSRSSSAKCRSVQDKMCNWYATSIKKSLAKKGVPLTNANVYFAWNQGVTGMAIINDAANNNVEVTNPRMRNKMAQQAWNKHNTTYDGKEFIERMNEWVRTQRDVDPTAMA